MELTNEELLLLEHMLFSTRIETKFSRLVMDPLVPAAQINARVVLESLRTKIQKEILNAST